MTQPQLKDDPVTVMASSDRVPTLFEWVGGMPALERLTTRFYEKVPHARRARWVALLLETADETALPDDPEFRSAFVAYLEWGSRLAVINSQDGVAPASDQPMPSWGWGEVKGPYRP